MRLLLFQIRNADDRMLAQELKCFVGKLESLSRKVPLSIKAHNIISDPKGYDKLWREHDIILVGGSGDYGCVGNTEEWFLRFCDVLRAVVERDKPMFCSCFGHQALAVALGGEVSRDKSKAELGTHEVSLNDEGLADPLLAALGVNFLAQFGHNDHVSRLPQGAVNMASTPLCKVQSYKLSERMVYATQFHPELSHVENRERAERYFKVYAPELADPANLDALFRPSESASELLPRFVEMVRAG